MELVDKFFERLEKDNIGFVDFRFSDIRGKWQHLTYRVSQIDSDLLEEGIMFDASSIAGWKAINESDMSLVPDLRSMTIDPFFAEPTLSVVCDVVDPATGSPYERDSRAIAKNAENYLRMSGIADQVFVGPEAEFFVFDDVNFEATPHACGFRVQSSEFHENAAQRDESGSTGHVIGYKAGYLPVPPNDSAHDMRSEMLSTLESMGVEVEKHHHEVAAAQHELGVKFNELTLTGDFLQAYKYCVTNVAHAYGKSATFMPKPVFGDNGSGMHCHFSLWKDGQTIFSGNEYADLSETCLYFIGGVIEHARALNAFTNPTTNSYKRLLPGFEAPVLLAYSARNRSASCRIPYSASAKGKRVEVRFPDPSANPYLAFSSILMAGLDGIANKRHPGNAMDKNLYDLPPQELKDIPTVCTNLREALENLDRDRAFLKRGDVMTDDFIDAYLALKMEEVERFEQTPHGIEYAMYYSV